MKCFPSQEAGLQISTSTRNPETINNLDCSGEATSRKKRQAEATVDTMSSTYIGMFFFKRLLKCKVTIFAFDGCA